MKSILTSLAIALLVQVPLHATFRAPFLDGTRLDEVRIHRKEGAPLVGELIDFGSRTYQVRTADGTVVSVSEKDVSRIEFLEAEAKRVQAWIEALSSPAHNKRVEAFDQLDKLADEALPYLETSAGTIKDARASRLIERLIIKIREGVTLETQDEIEAELKALRGSLDMQVLMSGESESMRTLLRHGGAAVPSLLMYLKQDGGALAKASPPSIEGTRKGTSCLARFPPWHFANSSLGPDPKQLLISSAP